MMQHIRILGLYLFTAVISWPVPAIGAPMGTTAQLIEKNGSLCAEQTVRNERSANIPRHLLTAISLVESGFWDASRKVNVAWPWTVTSGSKNWHFATKGDAITQVLELWADGVKNIDVGCMQINLQYHGGAFKDLEQAFDPSDNVAYATKFLKNMYDDAKSWTQAAGYYHSKSPARYRPYKLKVIKAWNAARRSSGSRSNPDFSLEPMKRRFVHMDKDRTNELNARLRAARAASRGAQGKSPLSVRQGQLAVWRGGASGIALSAAKRRAQLKAQRLKEMRGEPEANGEKIFAAKRRDQLQLWRRNVAKVDAGL